MTNLETRLRESLSRHLDPVQVDPLPGSVRRRIRIRRRVNASLTTIVIGVIAVVSATWLPGALSPPDRSQPITPAPAPVLDPATLSYAWSVRVENGSALGEVVHDSERIYVPTVSGAVAYPKACSDPCEPVWRLEAAEGGGRAERSMTSLALEDGVLVVNVANRLAVVATDCGEGGSACRPLWIADPIPGTRGYGAPVIADGVVKVITNKGNAPDNRQTAVAFELRCRDDGGECSPLWRADLGSGTAHVPGVAVGGVFYQQVATRMTGFVARCRIDGGECEPDFVVESLGDPSSQASSMYGPVLHDGTLVLVSGLGTVAGYPEHCGTSCEPRWTTRIADYLEAYPFIAGDVVVVAHGEGVTAVPLACGDSCAPSWQTELGGYWPVEYADADEVVVARRSGGPKRIAVLPAKCADPCDPLWSAEMSNGLKGVASDGTTVFASDGPRVLAFPNACTDPCQSIWSADIEKSSWNLLIDERTLVATSPLGVFGANGTQVTVFIGSPR
jgi:hypothetical protein